MALSGPSKEELENYFRNSRQYFDEIAKHYYATDRKYYDEYIAPFYNNPFRSMSSSPGTSGPKTSAGPRAALIIAVLILTAAAGLVFLFIASEESSDDNNVKEEKTIETNNSGSDDNKVTGMRYYERGIEYYNNKDYDNARKYLKRVPRKDENYPDAVKKLKEIEEMNIKNPDERRNKPQPKQRYN